MVENEPVAANLYKSYLLPLPDVKEVTVQEAGLIMGKDDTVLAASPDRIATMSIIVTMLSTEMLS